MPLIRMLLPLITSLALPMTLAAENPGVPTSPPPIAAAEIRPLIDALADEHGLDPVLVCALIAVESDYDPRAVSPKGAVGLMQVMPETGADYGVTDVERLFDPEINLRTGMRHLKRLLEKYGAIGPAVMAYNAGEGALERNGGFIPYPETQRYTHRVLLDYLIAKGLRPYSPEARDLIGLNLRPEMAVAGGATKMDRAGIRRLIDQHSTAADPGRQSGQGSMLQSRRLLSGRVSSRLQTTSNSLLKSRLMQPKRAPSSLSPNRP